MGRSSEIHRRAMREMLIDTGSPVLQRYGKKFTLAGDLTYKDLEGTVWVVPRGFTTDLASIPSFCFWWQWGCFNFIAILHDHGYEKHTLFKLESNILKEIHVSRKFCDLLFYRGCRHVGVSRVEAFLMYLAVRIVGKFLW